MFNVGGGRECLTFFKVLLSSAQWDVEPVSTFLNPERHVP